MCSVWTVTGSVVPTFDCEMSRPASGESWGPEMSHAPLLPHYVKRLTLNLLPGDSFADKNSHMQIPDRQQVSRRGVSKGSAH